MPKTPTQNIVLTALQTLDCLWDETEKDSGIDWATLEAMLEERGMETNRRLTAAIVDGAIDFGLDLYRPHTRSLSEGGYRFLSRPFEEWEVAFLADAVATSRALSSTEKSTLKTKLGKLLPKRARAGLARQFATDPSTDPYRGKVAANLAAIQEGISQRTRIEFDYWEYTAEGRLRRRKSSTKVPVEPYAFVYRDDAYYLYGGKVVDGEILKRTWRLDRMDAVTVTDEACATSVADLKVPISQMLSQSFGMFLSEEAVEVELSFDGQISKAIVERFGKESLLEPEDGRGRARVTASPSPAFYAWVFSFAGKVAIESPGAVREEYRRALLEAAHGAE